MRDSKLPKRQYTEEFKSEAIRHAESVGGHEAARRLGVPVATLGNWSRRRRVVGASAPEVVVPGAAAVPTRRPVSELEAENSRLRRELADARLDVEILRKATAYFAKGSR
jgi:transposase